MRTAVAACIVLWLGLFLSVKIVLGHNFYDYDCCSDRDCGPVADGEIAEEPAGFRIKATGEFIDRDSPKVRLSPDGQWHRCSLAGNPAWNTLCIYVPGRGA